MLFLTVARRKTLINLFLIVVLSCRVPNSNQCAIGIPPRGLCEGWSHQLWDWAIIWCGSFPVVPRCQIHFCGRTSRPICLRNLPQLLLFLKRNNYSCYGLVQVEESLYSSISCFVWTCIEEPLTTLSGAFSHYNICL